MQVCNKKSSTSKIKKLFHGGTGTRGFFLSRILMIALFVGEFFFLSIAVAQEGLILKISIGPGCTTEYPNRDVTSFGIATKNHAIGWGFTDDFAVQIGEFGSLNMQKVGEYNFINLDAFGAGFSLRVPFDVVISVMGAYGMVSFAKEWWEPTGVPGGQGYGANISIDKEWRLAEKWGIRLGPQVFYIKSLDTDYSFFNVSLNFSVVFNLTPMDTGR